MLFRSFASGVGPELLDFLHGAGLHGLRRLVQGVVLRRDKGGDLPDLLLESGSAMPSWKETRSTSSHFPSSIPKASAKPEAKPPSLTIK